MLFKNQYRIDSMRLKGWNYKSEGIYFITICSKEKGNVFGEIIKDKIKLNEIGIIAEQYIKEIPAHHPNIILDEFIVMPDHVHMILINKNRKIVSVVVTVETCHGTSLQKDHGTSLPPKGTSPPKEHGTSLRPPSRGSISIVVNHYKGAVKRYCNINNITFFWQPGYYDMIIRCNAQFENIRKYIRDNPISN